MLKIQVLLASMVIISISLFSVIGTAGKAGEHILGPIYISGLDDLLAQNIITKGTGTEQDPYLITGLNIDGAGADYGLVIENIHAYLEINNCDVSNVIVPQAQGGIVIRGCSNVTVRYCNIHDNSLGIRLSACHNVRVLDNRVSGNTLGIRIDYLSRDNLIVGNYFKNDKNAWACCSNAWDNGQRGNFWSDLSEKQVANTDSYFISPGNQDRMPANCNMWPGEVRNPRPPVKTATRGTAEQNAPLRKDTVPPVIKLKGGTEVHLAVGECFTDPGWVASDNRDGDLSSKVLCNGKVDTTVPGTYLLSYTVSDSSGNPTMVTRKVIVTDKTPPVIELIGGSQVHIPLGKEFKDPGATATDNCDGDVSNRITVMGLSGIDVSQPGIYSIEYVVTDKSGNRAVARRSVIVGWPAVIEYGSVTARLDKLDVNMRPVSAVVKVAYNNGVAPMDLQLQISKVVQRLVTKLAHLANMPAVAVEIMDQKGELAKLTVPVSDRLGKEDLPAICVLQASKINAFRNGEWLDFTQPPQTYEEAKKRIELALREVQTSLLSPQVKVTPVTRLDGKLSFNVQLSGQVTTDADGSFPALQGIRADTATMEFVAILATTETCSKVEVTFSADFYGLVYKNILVPTESLNTAIHENKIEATNIPQYWKEVFVHPVLTTP